MAKEKKTEDKGIALVLLGIVAILAIVGLVLLFSKATASGQVAKGGFYAPYYVGLGPDAYEEVSPRRAGELSAPVQFQNEVNAQASSGEEEQASIQSTVLNNRKAR